MVIARYLTFMIHGLYDNHFNMRSNSKFEIKYGLFSRECWARNKTGGFPLDYVSLLALSQVTSFTFIVFDNINDIISLFWLSCGLLLRKASRSLPDQLSVDDSCEIISVDIYCFLKKPRIWKMFIFPKITCRRWKLSMKWRTYSKKIHYCNGKLETWRI